MKNTTEQVVILDNIYSPYIRQAILILKDSADSSDTEIILEAERIVEKYFKNNVKKPQQHPKIIKYLCISFVVAGVLLFSISKLII